MGMGSVGENAPRNVVVDVQVEANFRREGSARNREKRHYYFGADIPAAADVEPPYQKTPSPTKSGFGAGHRRAGSEFNLDGGYRASPASPFGGSE